MNGAVVRARRSVALIVAATAAYVVGAPVASASPPANAGPMTQVFSDEFSGPLDTSVWEPGWGSDADITGPMSHRCVAKANVSVSSLQLHLRFTHLPPGQTRTCTDPSGTDTVTSLGALVDSQPRSGHPGFTYKYGYVEWRARTTQSPTGAECGLGSTGHCIAALPQLWSMDTAHNYEIDTFEGQHGKACYDTHPPPDSQAVCQGPAPYNDGGWHTYASLWTPSGTDYYYDDGVPIGHHATVPTSQFLVMDIIQGAPDIDGATIDVESVRVWQPDSDSDGLTDPPGNSAGPTDQCPNLNGPAAHHGCPDSDGDGLYDDVDLCVHEAGPVGHGGCVGAGIPATHLDDPRSWIAANFDGTANDAIGDVDGDTYSDLIAWNDSSVYVELSTGNAFTGPAPWIPSATFSGTKANLVGDVNGDRKADLIAWNDSSVYVELSTGTGFTAPQVWIPNATFSGNRANLVGDVNGDLQADLIAWNDADVYVELSTGTGFTAPQVWVPSATFSGNRANLVGDVNGDLQADLIAWNDADVYVELSTGTGFTAPRRWQPHDATFYGNRANLVGDVTGDGNDDLVAWNGTGVTVERGLP
jgi:hypothetical protein